MVHAMTALGGMPVVSHHLAAQADREGGNAVETMASWSTVESIKYKNCIKMKSFHDLIHCQSIHGQCGRAYI